MFRGLSCGYHLGKNVDSEVEFIAECFRVLWEKVFVPLTQSTVYMCFREGCCDVDSKAIKTT